MRKIYLLIIQLIAFNSFVKAQPILHQSNYPGVGESYAALINFTAEWTPGTNGVSQSWDFSSISNPSNSTFSYSAPSSVPVYGATFSSSDIALNPFPGQYSFFLSNAAKFEISGTVTNLGTAVIRPYTDPQTIVTFPFTYLDEFKDTAKTSDYNVSSGRHQRRIIYSKTKGDGYGSLILPGPVTYNNVLRLEITSKTIDSTFDGSNAFYQEDISIDTNYYWVSSDHKPHVFVLSKSIQDPTGAATTTIISQYFSNPGIPTGTTNAYDSYFSIYPNPVTSELSINIDKNLFANNPSLTFSLFNLSGREVLNSELKNNFNSISRKDIPSGLYFYKILSDNKIVSSGKLTLQ